MQGAGSRFAIVMVCAVFCLPVSATTRHRSERKHPAKADPPAVTPAPLAPPGPLVPLTLAQTPANPPVVTYNNGELTIVAENSTLADILKAVQARTGAEIDVPPTATERVVSHFGPGPARQVMADLLNGSHFNYVMMGSASDPNALAKVILTAKVSGEPEPPAPNQAQMPARPGERFGQTAQTMSDDETDDSADTSGFAGEQATQPSDATKQQPAAGSSPIKTPEQLLQELQRQQQLQQQAAPQNGATPTQPGPPQR